MADDFILVINGKTILRGTRQGGPSANGTDQKMRVLDAIKAAPPLAVPEMTFGLAVPRTGALPS